MAGKIIFPYNPFLKNSATPFFRFEINLSSQFISKKEQEKNCIRNYISYSS